MTPARWRDSVGALIEDARGRESIRSVAQRAGVDEALWRQVERGYRPLGGTEIVANPRDGNLEAIALAVGLDPSEVFAAVGRPYTPSRRGERGDRLTALEERFDRLEEKVQQLVDRPEP